MIDQEAETVDTGVPAPEKIDARWLWDYDYLWLQFEANLRGGKLKRNPKTETWEIDVPKDAVPFMNEQGIKDVMALLRANCNVVTGSSIMEKDRVWQWCERIQKDLADMLYVRIKDYELDDSKYLVVISTFMVAYEANLSKSIGGTALKYAMQAEHYVRTEQVNNSPSQGLLGRVFGRR
jgi:hypothetical protein